METDKHTLEASPGTESDVRPVLTDYLSHCLDYIGGKTSTTPDRTTVVIYAVIGHPLYKLIDGVT